MQLDPALARQARISRVADQASMRALRLWQKRMGTDFDTSWLSLAPDLATVTVQGQAAAAAGASSYLAVTANADGMAGAAAGTVQPGAFTGVDASGRTLDGLLYGAVTTAKTLIGGGSGLHGALIGGATYLTTMVHTAVVDTGRSADLTAMTARRYTHYVRVVSAGACSRCAILAGTASAKTPFLRHPRCRCTAAPVTDDEKTLTAAGRFSNPDAYFQSLPPGEQDRVFTKAGAEAIRAGADPVAVVSARRGATGIDYSKAVLDPKTLPNSGRRLERSIIGRKPDGTPILGYTTGEGTTVRGAFGRQNAIASKTTKQVGSRYRTAKRVRLMPETIIGLTDDVGLRQVLLRDAGYLTVPTTEAERATTIGGYLDRRDAIIRADRATADAFYREHGISLG